MKQISYLSLIQLTKFFHDGRISQISQNSLSSHFTKQLRTGLLQCCPAKSLHLEFSHCEFKTEDQIDAHFVLDKEEVTITLRFSEKKMSVTYAASRYDSFISEQDMQAFFSNHKMAGEKRYSISALIKKHIINHPL